MPPVIQYIIVALLVIAAALFFIRGIVRRVRGRGNDCGCGAGQNCPSHQCEHCPERKTHEMR
ncbi:MAG: hypothetical protein K6A95_09350 [Bacteroidales bacterium]|nr:hypothetical protein [Bacteroidales bacterium]